LPGVREADAAVSPLRRKGDEFAPFHVVLIQPIFNHRVGVRSSIRRHFEAKQ
jgi:hypothetical protein